MADEQDKQREQDKREEKTPHRKRRVMAPADVAADEEKTVSERTHSDVQPPVADTDEPAKSPNDLARVYNGYQNDEEPQNALAGGFVETDEDDYQEGRASGIGRIIKATLLTLFLLILFAGAALVFLSATGVPGEAEEVTVTIPEGATQREAAQLLADNHIVFNGPLFDWYLRVTGGGDAIKSGQYALKTNSGFPDAKAQIYENFKGDETIAKLTIPEGVGIEKIAEILADQFVTNQQSVLETLNDPEFLKELQQEYPELLGALPDDPDIRYALEGYLFPATYDISAQDDVASTIKKMVQAMDIIRSKYKQEIADSELSFHEILTLASLIEAEAASDEDRKLIAGVFYNRLANNMPLQSDITINYAKQQHASRLSVEDTQVDSPYNLYQNTGLRPGPFDSPSEASIQAALEPEESDYLYFVADLKTGAVYYSKTYEEHLAKKAKYLDGE